MEINKLLTYALDSGASDLHVSSGSIPMVRINGIMKPLNMSSTTEDDMDSILPQVMSDDQIAKFRERKEIDFSARLDGKGRFRVNFFHQIRGLAAVFRAIPEIPKGFEELALPPILENMSMLDRGLILLTGPTGSGKSTTLAAMVDHINQNRESHIITIEDPVEYFHHSNQCMINQRELGASTHSFANALRSALREDPDVILVGELRDLETIQLALTAAETGHLVFGTLHTSSAAKTIDRIVDVFPAAEKDMIRAMLSESLRSVISQTLLKRNGGGRIAAHEIMIGTPAIRNLIRENKIAQMYSAIQTGQRDGMQTLDQCLKDLVRKGQITRDAAKHKAMNPNDF